MSSTKMLLLFFGLVCILQWGFLVRMIQQPYKIREKGVLFKFKTAPIDPVDPFRGKYIQLQFEASESTVDSSVTWSPMEKVYATLSVDTHGFARIDSICKTKPDNNKAFVGAIIQQVYKDSVWKVSVSYPFDRFYMEESKSPEAEKIYMETSGDSTRVVYAAVKILHGKSALTNVFINEVPIQEVVEKKQKTESK